MLSNLWHTFHLRNGPLTSLYLTHSILNFGLGLIGIFIPIYIFNLTGSFFFLPAFYGIASAVAVLVFVFEAGFVARLGVTRLVLASNLARIFNLTLLLLAPRYPAILFLAAIFEGLLYPTYWVAYHVIFASRGHDGSYGREIGWMGIFTSIAAALAPLIGGLVVSTFGFPALYGLGMIVIFLSSFPIFFAGDHLGFHPMSSRQIIRESFSREWRPMFFGLAGMRLELIFATLFWPLFLFAVLGSYTVLGGLATVQIGAGVVLMMLAGSSVDKKGSRKVFPRAAILLVPFWLLVGFFRALVPIASLIMYRGILGPFYGISADSLYYSVAKRDPYTAVIKREFVIHLSAVLWCGLAALMWALFPANWPILFIPAAIGPLVAIIMIRAK